MLRVYFLFLLINLSRKYFSLNVYIKIKSQLISTFMWKNFFYDFWMLDERRPLTTKIVVWLHIKTIKISTPPYPGNQCCVMLTYFHPGPYTLPHYTSLSLIKHSSFLLSQNVCTSSSALTVSMCRICIVRPDLRSQVGRGHLYIHMDRLGFVWLSYHM